MSGTVQPLFTENSCYQSKGLDWTIFVIPCEWQYQNICRKVFIIDQSVSSQKVISFPC